METELAPGLRSCASSLLFFEPRFKPVWSFFHPGVQDQDNGHAPVTYDRPRVKSGAKTGRRFMKGAFVLELNTGHVLLESVYDLLPKELQLPSSTESNNAAMSQKSGGEAGPPPPAALASDATSASSSMSVGGPCSAFPASSSPTMHSSTSVTDRASAHNGCSSGEGVSSQGAAEILGVDGRLSGSGGCVGVGGGGGGCQADGSGGGAGLVGGGVGGGAGSGAQQQQQQHLQTTPSKRRTVLNISPPPEDLLDDSRMSCQDEPLQDSEQSGGLWVEDSASNFSLVSSSSYNDNSEVPRKSRKRTPRQRPGPKPAAAQDASMDVFDADSAKAPHFVLSQLGPDSKACPKGSLAEAPQTGGQKGGALSVQYPVKAEGKELKILVQPESQHRARYLTEGSRGSVKDRTQQGFPTVKLEGVSEPVVLQVFVGNDAGRVKPHGFYQACRVTGRNTTACKEVDVEGTTVIEVCLDPSTSMTLAVDCVGILKLRNADVEARIGVAGSKKKSTRARLVFRVNIPRPDGSILTLQTPSSPILCTQPAGVPEILKKSLHSCTVKGGEEVFLIGKNFLKGTKVIFQENASDEKSWKAEAEIDMELFHQNHLIVKVPPYQNLGISSPVSVGIYVVTNAGRSHDVQPFTYTPEPANTVDIYIKKEAPPPAKPCTFEGQIKVIQSSSCLDSALMSPMMPLVKREEVTPMEVSNTPSASNVFKPTSDIIGSPQQSLEMSSSAPPNPSPYPSPMTRPPGDQEPPQGVVYASAEPLSTIQKQDLAGAGSFPGPATPCSSRSRSSSSRTGWPSWRGPCASSRRVGSALGLGAGPSLVEQVLEAAAQQQLSSVLFSAAPSADGAEVQEMQQAESSIATQQQQQQQQQQQLQSELFQCGLFQAGSRSGTPEQQGSPQAMVQSHATLFQASEGLLHSAPQQQQQQQQQQQAALFQQAEELLSIQTSSFLQQPPCHPSPPQQLFHSPSPLDEAADPQGALFQATLTMLTGSSLSSPEQQPPGPSLFLPDAGQQTTFLTPMQTAPSERQPAPHPANPQPGPPPAFQNLSPTPRPAPPPQQQQQAGLLYCSDDRGGHEQPPELGGGAQPGGDGPPQALFQDQQPMQVGPSSGPASEQLFMSQTAMFAAQNGVAGLQTSSSSPVQQQPGSLFQTAVGGTLSQPGQTEQTSLFLFGIQNECGQLINSTGPMLSDQLIAISQSGQSQRESDAQIQSLLGQSLSESSGAMQGGLSASQNMEKIDDLLTSLQEQSNTLSRSY
ncbi:hypothetical protein ANANG_G00108130 [Anguilla anguilla]|uniref:Nuclear factor of activated T-cells 5 n=1 Tax=Anguilla anguilla TaxID=7936 RepID=A0A9D3RZS4_ANGAN|nr:hypothetical protein ANANG_G00108130 [Anguilla anguilla]